MPPSEETGSGPVIHDHRRIDPVTGQVRGKHAASKPAGTRGAGRPGQGSESANSGEPSGSTGSHEDQDAQEAAGKTAQETAGKTAQETAGETAQETAGETAQNRPDGREAPESPEEAIEMVTAEAVKGGKQAADLEAQLAERTADLQRLQAEYANYRKRVDRDRAAVREQAVAGTLAGLLPVLDAIDQAREHGELSGGFKSVADSLQAALGRLGLVTYGEKGDPFDPKIHEALTHSYSSDVDEDTCVEILQPGYKVGDRILRPARVAVAEPATGPDGISNDAEWPADEEEN
jgi:molecular chaperone GrpE